MDLTVQWVDKVRNDVATGVFLGILRKRGQALEQRMVQVLMVGPELAVKASVGAVR